MIFLTRYLYIEQDVLAALFLSILEKKKDEALFWAYELYYSGFEDHVAKFLSTIYHQSFRSLHPRLKKHIDQWEVDCISKPESIGNMVVNMCSPARKYDITFYLFSTMPADINTNLNETKIIINIHTRDILPYQTIDHTKETHCKILPKVCYIFLIFGLNYFILDQNRSVFDAFLFGLVIYGVFDSTNMAIFKKYNWNVAIMDTIWGGTLMALTTSAVYAMR